MLHRFFIVQSGSTYNYVLSMYLSRVDYFQKKTVSITFGGFRMNPT